MGPAVDTAPVPLGELRRLVPLLDDERLRTVERLRRHPAAPRWSQLAGDRLDTRDVEAVDAFRRALAGRRPPPSQHPPEELLAWIAARRAQVPSFAARIREGTRLEARWAELRTSSREEVATHPEALVPLDAELARMLVYRTSGTTGHALLVPHDRRAAACYLPMLELALARHGLTLRTGPGEIACFLVGAQARTVTYATSFSVWQGAGFAKLNLRETEWRDPRDPARFFAAMEPQLLTGDPLSFAELLRSGVEARPLAMVTTAVAMTSGLKEALRARFGCPVIDWYSLTETGPIGYGCPMGPGYHVLPHDLWVEALDPQGYPVAPRTRGEITVTGGRNPFLPLLRYRTGDWGRIEEAPCACGDPMPRILDLEGRAPVVLLDAKGGRVNPVDVSGALRSFPIVQHELAQRADRSCEVTLRMVPGASLDEEVLRGALARLFGDVRVEVRLDPALGERTASGKALPYRSDLYLEE